jgi:O-antigen ligase
VRATYRNPVVVEPSYAALVQVGVIIVLSASIGAATAGMVPRMPVVGLAIVAGAAALLSLTPKALFLSWFAVAPLIQESASRSAIGHQLGLMLYIAPSLIFAIWTLTRRSQRIRPRFLDVLPLAYLLYLLTSFVVAGDVSSSSVKSFYFSAGIGIVLYYFFAIGPIGSLSWESIAGVALVVAVTEGSMSIIDGLTGWNLWHDADWQGAQSRAVATLGNPAVLGTLLGMGIVIASAILVWNGPARLRPLAIVTLLVGFPGLYFTLTRAPIIGTLVAVILVLMSRTKTRLFALATIVVAGVVVTASWSRLTTSTVYRQRVTNSDNVQVRVLLQDWSLKLAEEKPLFGWGYNSFDRAKQSVNLTAGEAQKSGLATTSHNTYLTILVDYGIIGLLLVAIPWLTILWGAFKDVARRPNSRWFTVGALAALVVYVVANNGNDFKYFSFLPAVAWILLGLLRRTQLAGG